MSQHRLPHYSATNAGQSMHPPPTCQACHHGSFNIHPSRICNYFCSKPNQAEQHPRANNRTQLIVSIGVQTPAKQYHTTIKPFHCLLTANRTSILSHGSKVHHHRWINYQKPTIAVAKKSATTLSPSVPASHNAATNQLTIP